MAFPQEHWRHIRSTNGWERLNREIGRHFDVVGVFPNREAVMRRAGAILSDQENEWATSSRRYVAAESMLPLVSEAGEEQRPEGKEVSQTVIREAS